MTLSTEYLNNIRNIVRTELQLQRALDMIVKAAEERGHKVRCRINDNLDERRLNTNPDKPQITIRCLRTGCALNLWTDELNQTFNFDYCGGNGAPSPPWEQDVLRK